jgi:hypothetical protein
MRISTLSSRRHGSNGIASTLGLICTTGRTLRLSNPPTRSPAQVVFSLEDYCINLHWLRSIILPGVAGILED